MKIQQYDRTTRLCRMGELDPRLQAALSTFSDLHLLGDLTASSRISCETHSVPVPVSSRRRSFLRRSGKDAAATTSGVVVTDRLIIIGTVWDGSQPVCLGGKLADLAIQKPSQLYGSEAGVFIHTRWLGSSEASSYLLPLGSEPAANAFLGQFMKLVEESRQH
ncbi:hypothetical protein ACF08N_36400 [Streptomyces sp. NPDC015127]|uniref:hypothetical protein n=1 Tax=Streptomyces sp. NPDC015127 TaxID=3364939 RepID=UPI0036FC5D1F